MKRLWESIKRGYLRVIEPFADLLVRSGVSPNAITLIGTLCTVTGGVIYGAGHIRTAGWFLGLTALFDVLDGTVARRTGRSSTFGAFYDSTLDRVADGAVLSGLAVFYAREAVHAATAVASGPGVFAWLSPVDKNLAMVVVCLAGIVGTFLVSYTRARAEALGVDAKVGVMQRPERVTLLSAPQAFFGLALYGWVLMTIVLLLTFTAWLTAFQRMAFVHRATSPTRMLLPGAHGDAGSARADATPVAPAAVAASPARRPHGGPPSSSPAAPRV
ncbi:MAG TPA: CDP-alcohol phosphatidyltransferase family protein [Gemmatimonadaceae bacterium]|nr:CDP-alcohol phosphatidyltransferase family protein [Gemmatimonadaceae bacterium]